MKILLIHQAIYSFFFLCLMSPTSSVLLQIMKSLASDLESLFLFLVLGLLSVRFPRSYFCSLKSSSLETYTHRILGFTVFPYHLPFKKVLNYSYHLPTNVIIFSIFSLICSCSCFFSLGFCPCSSLFFLEK